MKQHIKNIAYAGYIAKGTVYALTGVLALLAAFNLGGKTVGKLQIIDFLEKQPFGQILLALLGLGLACYAVWRFIQSVKDPENIGNDSKGMVKRVSFFVSGMVYLGLGVLAFVDIFSEPSGSGNNENVRFLMSDTSSFFLIVLGVILGCKAIYQLMKAYKGDFLKKFGVNSIANNKKRRFIKNMGYAGLIARGIVIGIISYFFVKAGLGVSGSDNPVKGTSEAFSFLQENTSGPWLMGLVAAGLICYGIYMFTMARYRTFSN